MEYTGERIIPEIAECGPLTKTYLEHTARYQFASGFINRTMVVLDVACGVGYGSKILAANAKQVMGCDLDLASVEYAKNHYHMNNIEYLQGNATALQFCDASFDAVVSFETIEHIENYRQAISEFRRVLRVGGLLIMSSPNYNTSKHDNKYHIKEFSKQELINELSGFADQQYYCQPIWNENLVHRALRKSRLLSSDYQKRKVAVERYVEEIDGSVQNIIVVARKST